MSTKSIGHLRELADLAGVPFDSHGAEHDDLVDSIEYGSELVQREIADLSETVEGIGTKLDDLIKGIDALRYILISIAIAVLFLAYALVSNKL